MLPTWSSIDEPAIARTVLPFSSSQLMTPMWARPRAPPLPSTRETVFVVMISIMLPGRGHVITPSRRRCAGGGGGGGGGAGGRGGGGRGGAPAGRRGAGAPGRARGRGAAAGGR